MQIQHRVYLALPKPDEFRALSKSGNKVKRSSSVKLHRAPSSDMARVGDVEDRQLVSVVVFDIQKRSAVHRVVEEHGFASLPRRFGKIRRWHDNEVAGGSGVSGRTRNDCTYNTRDSRAAKTLRQSAV